MCTQIAIAVGAIRKSYSEGEIDRHKKGDVCGSHLILSRENYEVYGEFHGLSLTDPV